MGGNNSHWSEERWNRLIEQWCADFGPEAAAKIMQSSISAVGGERMTFPSLKDLETRERDRRICTLDLGNNHAELAERFGVHVCTIRRVILKQRMINREKANGKGDQL